MKVIIDNKIPFIRPAIDSLADETVYLPGTAFTPDQVKDADALIIRTRTRCDRALLEGSRVKFIATATIGFDHIDTDYCRQAGISWANAPGCNSASVAQYLQSSLILLQQEKGIRLSACTLGIIGVGHVGSKVAAVAREHGMRILLNDPLREEDEQHLTGGSYASPFVPLSQIAEQCDILTFHVPLSRTGADPTYHLADHPCLESLKRHPVLINPSRGE